MTIAQDHDAAPMSIRKSPRRRSDVSLDVATTPGRPMTTSETPTMAISPPATLEIDLGSSFSTIIQIAIMIGLVTKMIADSPAEDSLTPSMKKIMYRPIELNPAKRIRLRCSFGMCRDCLVSAQIPTRTPPMRK